MTLRSLAQMYCLNRENEQLERAISTALDSTKSTSPPSRISDSASVQLPIELLVRPRLDRFEILAQLEGQRRFMIQSAYELARRGGTDLDDDDSGQETEGANEDRDAELQRAETEALRDLDQRVETIRNQMLYYSPRSDTVTDLVAHAPLDAPTHDFTEFDLSYPLDIEESLRQRPDLVSLVRALGPRFDADDVRDRVTRFRSIFVTDFAEQLVRRDLMAIEYELARIGRDKIPVAAEVVLPLGSARPLEFTTQLRLRDELEALAQAPSDTLIDDRIVAAHSQLATLQWMVRWYFKPRFGTDASTSRMIAETQLPIGETHASLALSSDEDAPLALSGLYWAEYVGIGQANDKQYRSRFTASVRVVTQCKRTGAEFEVGTESHGQATWREWPRDHFCREQTEEWLVLVARGKSGYDELMRQRDENAEIRATYSFPSADLFLPVWGGEDEASVLHAYRTLKKPDFMLGAVYTRTVVRIGGHLRKELSEFVAANGDWSAVINPLLARNDMALFALIADRGILLAVVPDDNASSDYNDVLRGIQLHAAQRVASGAWSDVTTLGGGESLLSGQRNDRLGRRPLFSPSTLTLDEFVTEVRNHGLRESVHAHMYRESEEKFDPESLALDQATPLTRNFTRGVEEMPLATLLATLYTPIIWRSLTWRERRFTNALFRRFQPFAQQYREEERRALYYNQIERAQPWTTQKRAGVPVTYNDGYLLGTNPACETALNPTPIIDAIEAEINRKLASMTPARVAIAFQRKQYSIGDQNSDLGYRESAFVRSGVESIMDVDWRTKSGEFLLDSQLLREFEELIQTRLVRRGILAAVTHLKSVGGSRAMPVTEFVQVNDTRHALDPLLSNGGMRTQWIGAYSHTTSQPDAYIVKVVDGVSARIEQRGSAPLDKGYDFQGIHGLIEVYVHNYNAAVHSTQMTDDTRQRSLAKTGQKLADLELAYNFLAFVASPLGGKRMLMAADLNEALDDRTVFFQAIAEAASRTGTIKLN